MKGKGGEERGGEGGEGEGGEEREEKRGEDREENYTERGKRLCSLTASRTAQRRDGICHSWKRSRRESSCWKVN